ncbi:MAG: response regulator [Oscillospiraceae bacterium]|nr:response regulator [Oscillospiraceae bacterium]
MIEPGNEYFFRIKGLMVPRRCDSTLIHKNINRYIDLAQPLSEKLEKSFTDKRYDFFAANMETALSMLNSVYARWLETEGDIILRWLRDNRMPSASPRIRPFIADMLTLSIEMQRVQNQAKQEFLSEVEQHADMADNLSAVGSLIGEGEYEQAQSMIAELEEYSPEAMLVNLLDLVTSRQYDKAGELANLLKEKHVDAIKTFGASADAAQKTILAVDDRPEILSGISAALKGRYKVFGVTGGKAALKFLQTRQPDLFILDIDMPDMDGYELSYAIRMMERHAWTPIIFLTGNSSREHVMKAMQAGGNDFIVKPANYDVLLTKAGKYLT